MEDNMIMQTIIVIGKLPLIVIVIVFGVGEGNRTSSVVRKKVDTSQNIRPIKLKDTRTNNASWLFFARKILL